MTVSKKIHIADKLDEIIILKVSQAFHGFWEIDYFYKTVHPFTIVREAANTSTKDCIVKKVDYLTMIVNEMGQTEYFNFIVNRDYYELSTMFKNTLYYDANFESVNLNFEGKNMTCFAFVTEFNNEDYPSKYIIPITKDTLAAIFYDNRNHLLKNEIKDVIKRILEFSETIPNELKMLILLLE